MRGFRIACLAGAFLALSWASAPAGAVAEAEPDTETSESFEAEAAASSGSVARAAVTLGVSDREPHAPVEVVGGDATEVFYFTELVDLTGQTVVHRWEQGGEVRAEVAFEVGGPRWRVFSSKQLDPGWQGEWTVSVVDPDGRVMRIDRFFYRDEAPSPAQMPPAAAERP